MAWISQRTSVSREKCEEERNDDSNFQREVPGIWECQSFSATSADGALAWSDNCSRTRSRARLEDRSSSVRRKVRGHPGKTSRSVWRRVVSAGGGKRTSV